MPERTVVSLTVLVPYVACAAAYLALTALILGQARRSRTGLWLAAAAVATAFWASAGGLAAPPDLALAFDLLRLLAWYGFCLHLYMEMHRPGTGGAAQLFITIGAAGVVCAAAAILFGQADLDGIVSLVSPAILLRLGLGIGQLLVLENLYRDTAPEQRRHVGLACIALGGMAAYDVVLCADAVLVRGFSPVLLAGRPVVAVLVTPLLAVAAARNRDWRVDIHVSRTAAFHSATLVVSGVFLLALAAVGELARRFGPALGIGWGSLAEIYLLCAGVLTLAVLLTSGVARSVLRRNLVDHFFTHRYDYRQEWQRCIGVLSAAGPLPQRVIRVLADVVDSPSGLLFLHEPGQPGLAWAGSWNTSPSGPLSAADATGLLAGGAALLTPGLLRFRGSATGVTEADHLDPSSVADLASGTDLADRAAVPFEPWLAVPLREPDSGNAPPSRAPAAMGCILLAHPRAPFRVDDEVLDLLRILAHEVAIHLAQERAAASLLQTRELHAYGERFAFVAHDIKNVSSQLSLLLANAETHLADPAFQQDMLATVRSSVARIGGLIRRLEPARGPDAANSGLIAPARVDAATQLAKLLAVRVPAGGTRLSSQIDPPAGVMVGMEAAALQAAVTHLLDNAVTAAGPAGAVRVALRATPAHVVIDIADDGPGMTPEFIRDELFRPFSTRTEGGSGLGAFQARALLRAAGGGLTVLSTPGHGTTMRLSLPREGVASATPKAAAAAAPAVAQVEV